MKMYIKSGTHPASMPAKVMSADDGDTTIDDMISDLKDDFDYIVDGLDQLDMTQRAEIVNSLNDSLSSFIQDIASYLSE